jgi:hypothetical protein
MVDACLPPISIKGFEVLVDIGLPFMKLDLTIEDNEKILVISFSDGMGLS